ncbi:MAG: DUF1707 and DUF2154 domain-containing protein [Gemmatimonadetes bacterium]|nr:DUF1707 and DUF2154 domain-containing protein [Gemmatimonadota bacterium]
MTTGLTGEGHNEMEAQVSAAARTHAIDLLSEHFAQDHLTLDEFERRVTRAHSAKTIKSLQALLLDLPTGNVPATIDDGSSTDLQKPVAASVPSSRVRAYDRTLSIFSETKRQGRWIPAKETQAISVLGSTVIDLREALLGPGETVIKCYTVLGSVEIIAPEGLYVECGGSAFLGSFERQENSPVSSRPDAPVVRVDGFSVLGSVEIEFREPGESKREAKRRRRRERKERKRLRSG